MLVPRFFLSVFLALTPSFLVAQTNAVPFVNQTLVPTSVVPGAPGVSLTVSGTGFTATSVVNWNGVSLSTTFVSSSKLFVSVPASSVAVPNTASITVFTPAPGGGTSNAVPFTVTAATNGVTFTSSTIGVGLNPGNVVVADFNNDGKPDLAVVNLSQPNPACYVYAGDVGTISILLGNGDGTFTTASTLCVPETQGVAATAPMLVGDFNGDGKLDLLVSYHSASRTAGAVFLGNGDGTFTTGQQDVFPELSGAVRLFPAVAADVNSDGKLDLAIPYFDDFGYNDIGILLGSGNGSFGAPARVIDCTGNIQCYTATDVVAGDFNGDGILDLASLWFGGTHVTILLGKGDGTFAPASQQPSATLATPTSLATGDFDGDGVLDLAIADASSNGLTILHGNGDGTFTQVMEGQSTYQSFGYVTTGDLNGDGKLDLVFSGGGNTIQIFLGNGDGTFQPGFTETVGNNAQSVAIADFNGDGRLDLAVVNSADNTVSILLQNSVAQASVSALTFGNETVGFASGPQAVSLTNVGSATMVISSVQISGDYQIQTNQCTGPVAPGAQCNVSITFVPSTAGTRSGHLSFNDNAMNAPQTVTLSGVGIAAETTTTVLKTWPNPSQYGQAVVLAAAVIPGGAGTPTGNVTFLDGTSRLASVPLNHGVAMFTTSTLTAGSHSISAVYGGDNKFGQSTSATLAQTVTKAPAAITISSSPNPSYVHQPVTVTAVVSGAQATPTGLVTFSKGATVLATVSLVSGKASFSAAFTESLWIAASYSGDLNYLPSNSKGIKQVVQKRPTSTVLTLTPNPSIHGRPVTLAATVSSNGATPTGIVSFIHGRRLLGSAVLTNGVATITEALPSGSYEIVAYYGGDNESGKSASPALIQVVH